MSISQRVTAGLIPAVAALFLSCATVSFDRSVDEFREEIARHEAVLDINPQNADALRDLGAIYVQTRQFAKAKDFLTRAARLKAADAKTRFFTGMLHELQNDPQAALAQYTSFADYSPLSPYRRLMQGRYETLIRETVRAQFRSLVTQELQLTDNDVTANTIAVFPLVFGAGDERYASLGKGLSELFIADLGNVSKLRLVERVRVRELSDELQLSRSAAIDQSTAPRLGRLLKAERIVTGVFSVSPDKAVQITVNAEDVLRRAPAAPFTRRDDLDKLFRLQKDAVFDLLTKLEISITPAERDRIARNPTNSVDAFLLYSIGLEKEDARDFIAARSYYQEALSLDRNFTLAATRAAAMDGLITAGTREQTLAAIREIESRGPVLRVPALASQRLIMLMDNAGVYPQSGSAGRSAPTDAYRAPAPILTLREPPRPPTR
ncbi:MAG: hypothetical protein HY962_13060 [Ignavibacteriae bacterium]|nr:hypothetical protein [Ignavibacteriota bacterium]